MSEIPNVGNFRKDRRRNIPTIRLIKSCKSWIWDQYLSKNMKFKFGNIFFKTSKGFWVFETKKPRVFETKKPNTKKLKNKRKSNNRNTENQETKKPDSFASKKPYNAPWRYTWYIWRLFNIPFDASLTSRLPSTHYAPPTTCHPPPAYYLQSTAYHPLPTKH